MRIASLRVGSLVRMVDDPHHIVGLVVEIIPYPGNSIKVNWLDEMCDPTFVNQRDLEIICK